MRVCAKTKAIFTEIATFPCKLACLTNTPNLNRLVEDLIQTHTHEADRKACFVQFRKSHRNNKQKNMQRTCKKSTALHETHTSGIGHDMNGTIAENEQQKLLTHKVPNKKKPIFLSAYVYCVQFIHSQLGKPIMCNICLLSRCVPVFWLRCSISPFWCFVYCLLCLRRTQHNRSRGYRGKGVETAKEWTSMCWRNVVNGQ